MGKPCAPANTGSTHASFAPQAKLPAERPARPSGPSPRDEERGHRSNSLDAAHQPKEQHGSPAASTSKNLGNTAVGDARPSTSKPPSAGSGRGKRHVPRGSDHANSGKTAPIEQSSQEAVNPANPSGPSSDQEEMEWQTPKQKQKEKKTGNRSSLRHSNVTSATNRPSLNFLIKPLHL